MVNDAIIWHFVDTKYFSFASQLLFNPMHVLMYLPIFLMKVYSLKGKIEVLLIFKSHAFVVLSTRKALNKYLLNK